VAYAIDLTPPLLAELAGAERRQVLAIVEQALANRPDLDCRS
jgi:hypothetical protein